MCLGRRFSLENKEQNLPFQNPFNLNSLKLIIRFWFAIIGTSLIIQNKIRIRILPALVSGCLPSLVAFFFRRFRFLCNFVAKIFHTKISYLDLPVYMFTLDLNVNCARTCRFKKKFLLPMFEVVIITLFYQWKIQFSISVLCYLSSFCVRLLINDFVRLSCFCMLTETEAHN